MIRNGRDYTPMEIDAITRELNDRVAESLAELRDAMNGFTRRGAAAVLMAAPPAATTTIH